MSLSEHISEVLAGTITRDAVEPPDGYDADWADPLTNDTPDEMYLTMYGAIRSFLLSTAVSAGYSAQTGMKAFHDLSEKEKEQKAHSLGTEMLASATIVRKGKHGGKKGYIASLPLLDKVSLFDYGTPFSAVRPYDYASNEGTYSNEAQRKFALKLFGKDEALKLLDARKSVDLTVYNPQAQLATTPFFDRRKMVGEIQDLEKSLDKYFMGFRFVSPPLQTGGPRYNGRLKEGERAVDGLPTHDQVEFPKDLSSFILSQRKFTAYFDIFVPEDYARYLTQCPSGEINIALLTMWFVLFILGDIGCSAAHDSVLAVSSLGNVRELNKKAKSFKEQIVNGDGLSISKDAYPYFLPTVDNIDKYEREFLEFGLAEDGSYSLRNPGRLLGNEFTYGETREDKQAKQKPFPARQIIYTDFSNFRLAYSDQEGLSKVENVEDWQALNASDAANILNRQLFADRTWNKVLLDTLGYLNSNRLEGLGINTAEYFSKANDYTALGYSTYEIDYLTRKAGEGIVPFLQGIPSFLRGSFYPKVIDSETGEIPANNEQVKIKHLFTNFVPPLTWIGNLLKDVSAKIRAMSDAELQDYISRRAVPNALREIGIVLTLGEYGPRQEQIMREDKERRRPYLEVKTEDQLTYKPPAIPYVRDGRFLLPHQAKVDNILQNNNPQFVILAADAGGGKTGMVLRDIVTRLSKGKIKRAIIGMPGKLIRNYIEDAVYFYGAGLNVIPITTSTLGKYGADRLEQMVKNAPANTVIVTTYRFIGGSTEEIFYGTDTIEHNANLELLKSFNADAIYLDESHFLRNDSNQTKVTRRLAYSIPYRVLATGTLVNNQLSDVANQVSIFIPSLFGNKSDFEEEYAAAMRGSTVIAWKSGAERALRNKLAENCLIIQCKRKEWAFMLPNRVEDMHVIDVDHSGEWYQTYQAILTETVELIKKDAKLMKKLESIDSADDDEEVNIEGLLRPYLQRLEIFLTAPEKDDVGSKVLKGKDRVGPKVHKINSIIKSHISKKIPGKILVFTSYHKSADSIYENLLPEYKKMAIRYQSEESDAHLAKFNRDDSIQILIGTENTLNTGLNLQAASRIIRVESVWTPGNLEQSMARVYRPDPKMIEKGGDKRPNIYLDWVVVNYTIDVTKIARLISKILVKVQFDEHDNAAFHDLQPLEVVSMTLDNILSQNDWNDTLRDYAEEYSKYLNIVHEDLEAYRNDPKNKVTLTKLERDPAGIKGDGLMSIIPYNPDHTLPDESKMKLVRMSDYASTHGNADEDIKSFDATGLLVHTEWGDGKVVRSSATTVRVKFADGKSAIFDKLSVFVINDKKLPAVPIKKQVAESAGLKLVNPIKASKDKTAVKVDTKKLPANVTVTKAPSETPIDKVIKKIKEDKKPVPTTEEMPSGGTPIAMEINSIYDMLAITLEDQDTIPKKQLRELESLGFKASGPYFLSTDIPNLARFDQVLAKIEENYEVKPQYMKVLNELRKTFTSGKAKTFTAHRAQGVEMKNFWRMQSLKAGRQELRPYPVIWEGDLHLAVRVHLQPAAKTVKTKLRVPGITWDLIENEHVMLCKDKSDVLMKLKKLAKAGYTPARPKGFKKSLDAVRVFKKQELK